MLPASVSSPVGEHLELSKVVFIDETVLVRVDLQNVLAYGIRTTAIGNRVADVSGIEHLVVGSLAFGRGHVIRRKAIRTGT